MNPYSVITICSFLLSIITVIIMVMGQRHTVSNDYVSQLVTRIENLERELLAAEARVKALEDRNTNLLQENIELLRRLAATVV